MAIKGIDISTYQRNVDFKKLKAAGVNFVILRAGYGNALAYPNQYDDMFESHYKNAKAAGLNVGAYWYLYATTVSGA
jgi:GH25 family lysozyme M1 (1,4-beta-N-acetylmuramidase)